MTAILRVESRRHLRGSLVLFGIFALLTVFMLAVFPAMAEEAEVLEQAFPDYALGLFGFDQLGTIEGFTGSYIFPFVWVLFFGMYFAYLGGGMIAEDVRSRRMDLLLSNPVSRESVVLQKAAALWVPLVVLNGGLFVVLLAGTVALDEPLSAVDLGLALLLSVPYLLVCAGIGLVFSVVLDRVESAQAAGLGTVFLLWLADGLSEMDPDLEWVGALTPSRHVDPIPILVDGTVPLLEGAVLSLAFLSLLGLATALFARRDI